MKKNGHSCEFERILYVRPMETLFDQDAERIVTENNLREVKRKVNVVVAPFDGITPHARNILEKNSIEVRFYESDVI